MKKRRQNISTVAPIFVALTSALMLAGCPDDTGGDVVTDAGSTADAVRPPPPPPPPPSDVDLGPALTTLSDEEGVTEMRARATVLEFVYLDLETKEEVDVEDASWDIGFARERIPSNGGVTGSAGVVVAAVADGVFDEIDSIEGLTFVEDLPDEVADGHNEYVISSEYGHATPWWSYNFDTHVLSPANMVYVIQSTDGNHFVFEVLDYYNEEGDSAYPRFRFKAIEVTEEDTTNEDSANEE